jgi:sec-independent protein translocase protein TatA
MGIGGISTWQLIILLLIIILIFGTRRLRSMGGDLGAAFKGFKQGLDEGSPEASSEPGQVSTDDTDAAPAEESAERPTEV